MLACICQLQLLVVLWPGCCGQQPDGRFAAFIVSSTSKMDRGIFKPRDPDGVHGVAVRRVDDSTRRCGCRVFMYSIPHYLGVSTDALRLGNRMSERVGLQAMRLIAVRFLSGATPVGTAELSAELKVPLESLRGILGRLAAHDLLRISGFEETAIPGRDLQNISIKDILMALRAPHRDAILSGTTVVPDDAITGIMQDIDAALVTVSGDRTLRDLALDMVRDSGSADTEVRESTGSQSAPSSTEASWPEVLPDELSHAGPDAGTVGLSDPSTVPSADSSAGSSTGALSKPPVASRRIG